MISELGYLANPDHHQDPIDISLLDAKQILNWFRRMIEIRAVEELTAKLILNGEIYTPCHLAIGQEAIAVGVAASLTNQDFVFSNHRSHAHYLALGGSIEGLLAEIFCRASGVSGGYGGSQHLRNEAVGFVGSVPIVGATIPVALGAAFSAKQKGGDKIAVCFFGDGASEEGVLHECLNIASTFGLPILFVCENNLYSSHLDIGLRQPSDRIARFADAHKVANETIDGNDINLVAGTADALIGEIRRTGKPAFLESVTFRLVGHVGGRLDEDVGVRRSKGLLNVWMKRDPIFRLKRGILDQKLMVVDQIDALVEDVNKQIQSIYQRVKQQPEPVGLETKKP